MKYLKSFKIYESFTKSVTLMFSEDYTNLSVNCKIDQEGLIVSDSELKNTFIIAVDDDAMSETFRPFEDLGIKVKYKGWESILQDEEYGGGYMEDIEGYFYIDVDGLNDAIAEDKIKLIPETDNPNEDHYFVKVIG